MIYVVFDLEATCWEKGKNRPNETIEIGAVLVSDARVITGEFDRFIKPVKSPRLSPFCTELTSIRQEDVKSAEGFPEIIRDFLEWITNHDENFMLCSWGYYDRQQLQADCELHGLDHSWLAHHISLKHQYAKIKKHKKLIGLNKALSIDFTGFEGTHHRGIDDARNLAKIFVKYFDEWKK
jgi:inhibitor of KinA sporulation pathway (predicted exonuclease)